MNPISVGAHVSSFEMFTSEFQNRIFLISMTHRTTENRKMLFLANDNISFVKNVIDINY